MSAVFEAVGVAYAVDSRPACGEAMGTRGLRALLQGFAMLGQVEAFDLVLLADAQRQEEGDRFEQNVTECAGPDEDGDHGINLDQDLSGVALEQARGAFRRVRARR